MKMNDRRINFLGFPVDNLTSEQLLEKIDYFVNHGIKCQIVALNANKLWQAQRDPKLRDILLQAELVIPEYAIVWGARILGTPLVEHVGGIMLMRRILEVASKKKYKLYFLGARPYIVETMVRRLKSEMPTLTISGWHHGYFDSKDEIIAQINKSGPDILFVAMGTPKQEYFIRDNFEILDVPIMMGVGGSFDVFAGLRKETPSFLRHGFEWIYRMVQDPWRLGKRYARTNPWFVYQVFRQKIRLSLSKFWIIMKEA